VRRVTYTDPDGRRTVHAIPDQAPDAHARMGIVVGPPDLRPLGWPPALEIALHNQLEARGVLTEADARAHMGEITAAIASVFKADAHVVYNLYRGLNPDGSTPEPD
jgi:hypothetical protein